MLLASAQNKLISGIVSDQTGMPVAGATVLVVGNTTIGTTTSVTGEYQLNVADNAVISVSFIGYKTVEVPVAGKTRIDVTLEEDSEIVEVVTVVGYGTGSKVGTTIGSVSKVKSEELENKPTANIADALQGKVAGLQIMTSSGEPTASSSIQLHGSGSLSASTAPLIVLDGVPVDASVLTSLNSNDIESINVLKDASATSIYGSRASNGVMYIATKRGRRNEDVRVIARAQYGISQPASAKFSVMNTDQLVNFQLEERELSGMTQSKADEILATGINTNWYDYYYNQSAPTYQVDLSVSGGTSNTAYYVSGSYLSKEGTAPGSGVDRYSFRSNMDINAKEWLKIGANVALSYDKRRTAYTESNSVYNAAFMSQLTLPWISPYDENGEEMKMLNGYYNPNYMIATHPRGGENLQVYGSAYVQLTPVKNLNIKSQIGVDAFAYWGVTKAMPSYEGSLGNGLVSRVHQNSGKITSTTTIDYNFDFDNTDHKLYLIVGQEGIRDTNLSFAAQRAGQVTDKLTMLSNGTGTPTVSDSSSGSVLCSFFGRAEYGFRNKYIFDASIRRDESSRFAANHRSGIFYAFGAMWDLKSEPFLANSSVVSDLKLKLSYGTQGNNSISDYAWMAHMNTTTYGENIGLYLSSIGNPRLSWETQRLFTVAAQVELLDRIRLEASFYNRQTDDMLFDVPIPGTTGFTSSPENVGAMLNRGIDLTLNVDLFRNRDWYVGFNATFNYNRNKMTRLFNGLHEYALANAGICYTIGHDSWEYYMQKFAGVNPETGAPQWEVIDKETGERSITEDYNAATQQLLGKSGHAPYTGGFGVNAKWKGLSLTADFSWNYGKYMVNNMLIFLEDPAYIGRFNRSTRQLDRWRKPGDQTNIHGAQYATKFDTSILEDSSFLRLKNLTVSYDLPAKWMERTGFLGGVRIYFIGRNIFTATPFSGYDPEVNSNMALGDYPNSREFVGGIQLTF